MKKNLPRYFPLFVLPTFAAFVMAFIIPFIMGIWLSFCKFTTVSNAKWSGLDNYRRAFSNSDFTNALWFTVKFTVVSVITVNVFAFLLALLLTKGIKGTNIFRTIFFMPNLIGGIVLGYIWNLIINGVLAIFGVDITFKAEYGFWGLVILTNWQLIGYMMVIYIAGLQNIPRDLNEAAEGGNQDAANAIDVLAYGIAKFVGGYVAAMNGVDAIVFTAGIGENAIPVREKVVSYLGYLGVTLDKDANGHRGEEIVISTPDSKVKVAVIPTNEELAICRETVALV